LNSDAAFATSHHASVWINIKHAVRLTRIAFRTLLSENKRGVILNIGSDASIEQL
jgi:short-subunit dehydrogenase